MKKSSRFSLRGKISPTGFLLLLAAEAASAALATFFLPADPKNALLLGRSLSRWLLIAALLGTALLLLGLRLGLRRNLARQNRVMMQLYQPTLAVLPVGLNLLLFAALIGLDPSPASALRLAPLLIWIQVGLLEYYWFFAPAEEHAIQPGRASWPLAAVTAGAVLLAAALTGLPSTLMDGLPWDRPLEYILVIFLVPAVVLIDWRAFAQRGIVILALAALALQITSMILLPEAGFRVHIYTRPENMQTGKWQPTYESILWPGESVIMTQPYGHTRQFPLEWIITDDYHFSQRWFALELQGTVTLQPGERLYFLVNGEQEAAFQLRLSDQSAAPSMILHPGDRVPAIDAAATYLAETLKVEGRVVYSGEQDHQLMPMIARADGSTFSALAEDRVWQTAAPAGLPVLPQALAWLGDALLVLAVALGLVSALWSKYRAGEIGALDLFLASWVAAAFFMGRFFPPTQITSFLLPTGLFLLAARLLNGFTEDQRLDKVFLVSAGLVLLVLLLRLDLGDLREIELFPDGQDNFRYQVISRYIYTSGDFLQWNRAPLIYKFLYPYIVGGLHILFGQSPAAQFLFNAWCAVLTGMVLIKTLAERGVSRLMGWTAASVWMILMTGSSFFLFYFRFGLIEPLAVLLYSLAVLFAIQQRQTVWLVTGMVLTLLRLDYAVLLFSTLWLGMPVMEEGVRQGLAQFLRYTLTNIRWLVVSGAAVILIPVGLTLLFWLQRGELITSAADTHHTSVFSIFEGWLRIFNGGSPGEVAARFQQSPLDIVLLLIVLYGGLLFATAAWLYRPGKRSALDRRWLVLFAAVFITYIIVRPTGYSPRFSTPVVVLGLLTLADGVDKIVNARQIRQQPDPGAVHPQQGSTTSP